MFGELLASYVYDAWGNFTATYYGSAQFDEIKIGVKGNAGSIGGIFSIGAKNEIGIAYGIGGSIIVECD